MAERTWLYYICVRPNEWERERTNGRKNADHSDICTEAPRVRQTVVTLPKLVALIRTHGAKEVIYNSVKVITSVRAEYNHIHVLLLASYRRVCKRCSSPSKSNKDAHSAGEMQSNKIPTQPDPQSASSISSIFDCRFLYAKDSARDRLAFAGYALAGIVSFVVFWVLGAQTQLAVRNPLHCMLRTTNVCTHTHTHMHKRALVYGYCVCVCVFELYCSGVCTNVPALRVYMGCA